MLILKTLRIRYHSNEPFPMQDIINKGLDDVVHVVVALQGPNTPGIPLPYEPILLDLAVCPEGIARVLNAYGRVEFCPLSDDDPIVQAQDVPSPELKKAYGYEHMYRRYLQVYSRVHQIARLSGCVVEKYLKDWFEGNMDKLGMLLMSQGDYFGDEGSSITF